QDAGTIINTIGVGPKLTSPDDPNLPPVSLIDNKTQAVLIPGATFTTSIAFKNSGDTPARDVVITQNVPDGIDYLPDSLQMVKGQVSVKATAPQPTEVRRKTIAVRHYLAATS